MADREQRLGAGRAARAPHADERGRARIGITLASLNAVDYPRDRFELVVIADNCGDRTASVAAAAGATVWKRDDLEHRGKGHALAWAFERLRHERPALDAVAVVDADCEASPELLLMMDRALHSGAAAVQVNNIGRIQASLRHRRFAIRRSL